MPDCDYCSEEFSDEDAYLEHLSSEHRDELGSIDQRRVEQYEGDDGTTRTVLYAVAGVVLLAAVAGAVYAVATGGIGSGGEPTPHAQGSVHMHGTISVTLPGPDGTPQELDFSSPRFQRPQQYPCFHFEGGEEWHVHCQGVSLQYGMGTLGIDLHNASAVTVGDTTYHDSDPGTTVIVEVNGEPVDPSTYVLQGPADPETAGESGDHIRVVVRNEST